MLWKLACFSLSALGLVELYFQHRAQLAGPFLYTLLPLWSIGWVALPFVK